MENDHIGDYGNNAALYAAAVDKKLLHTKYERPNTWSLLPEKLDGLTILDIGCGSGWYTEQLEKSGAIVTAIDVNAAMVELTKQRVGPEVTVLQMDANEPLNFPGQQFDIIVAPLVIHYIKNWMALFAELSRIIKPNGNIILSTHQPHLAYQNFNLDNYYELATINEQWTEPDMDVTYYHHSLSDLSEALYKNGFFIERILEPFPSDELKADARIYDILKKVPLFLFMKACL